MSTQSKHTPGPWSISNEQFRFRINGYEVRGPSISGSGCVVGWLNANYYTMSEANATLIAAAPDLLDALIGLLNIEHAALSGASIGVDVPYHFVKARAVIAAAKGE